jgi:hypothetical protein
LKFIFRGRESLKTGRHKGERPPDTQQLILQGFFDSFPGINDWDFADF